MQRCKIGVLNVKRCKNNENIKKIIGIIPINLDSIYSINETFKIEDFTNKTSHFIHETLIIEKNQLLYVMNKVVFYVFIKTIINLDL